MNGRVFRFSSWEGRREPEREGGADTLEHRLSYTLFRGTKSKENLLYTTG